MRVNHSTLGPAYLPAGPDKNSPRYVRGGKVINPKKPGQALPPQFSWRDLDEYKPKPYTATRPGADDHLKIRSIG